MQLTGLLDLLRRTEAYQTLLRRLQNKQAVPDQHILRSARPYVVAALAEDLNRPLILLAGRVDRAHNITEQLPVWVPRLPIQRFAEPSVIFYEHAPWTPTTIQNRLATLAALAKPPNARGDTLPPPIVVASSYALMQKTLPVREFQAGSRVLKAGHRAQPESLLRSWVGIGYESASIVVEPGTFSRRGGILDIYPVSARFPVRIEFFGDEIESLRTFNPATQRSADGLDQVVIVPAREALPRLAPPVAEQLRVWFAAQPAPEEDVTSNLPDQIELTNGVAFPHLEFYLPYLYSSPASLLDFAPDDALIVVEDWGALQDNVTELEEQALSIRQDKIASGQLPPDFPLPYLTWGEIQDELSTRQVLHLGTHPEFPPTAASLGDLFSPGQRHGGQLRLVLEELFNLYGSTEQIVVATQQAQRMAELWGEQDEYIHPVTHIDSADHLGLLTIVEGTLGEGWVLGNQNTRLHLLTDAEIFGWKRPEPRRRPQRRALPPESGFADLEAGDYVVHVEYGIGRFGGLQKRILDNTEREYLIIEYANNDMLYVPIHQADRISRYVGVDDRPPQLNRLGSQDWTRTKVRYAPGRRRSGPRTAGTLCHARAGQRARLQPRYPLAERA